MDTKFSPPEGATNRPSWLLAVSAVQALAPPPHCMYVHTGKPQRSPKQNTVQLSQCAQKKKKKKKPAKKPRILVMSASVRVVFFLSPFPFWSVVK